MGKKYIVWHAIVVIGLLFDHRIHVFEIHLQRPKIPTKMV